MSLYEFKSLSENQQTELVWSEGDFVDRLQVLHSNGTVP